MPEIHSPLANIKSPGSFGASFPAGPAVSLSETPLASLFQIAGWADFEAAVTPGLSELGFGDAGDFRQCRTVEDRQLYRISPDRLLIASQSALVLPDALKNTASLAVLDLSHARTCITVEGAEAEDVMARLAPIDFRAPAMPQGAFVQTGIHHVGVLIIRPSALRFDILTPVTWARSIWEIVCLNAAPFGYDVKGII